MPEVPCATVGAELGLQLQLLLKGCLHKVVTREGSLSKVGQLQPMSNRTADSLAMALRAWMGEAHAKVLIACIPKPLIPLLLKQQDLSTGICVPLHAFLQQLEEEEHPYSISMMAR
ncbi:hypothetical protein IHE44_0013445 [Lamprotornis superbus]|uniref:Uncharacterized protein n=1 Tax=Lamprotornis superbus TaxID=245042 RepID=A0A835NKC3_9PASS|nr:hypothetical protein IHE44_0013445 [Lamprotornis superbus]